MIGEVVSIVLAVVGVLIAWFQFRIERISVKNERERELSNKNKEKIMRDIAGKTKSICDLENILKEIKNTSKDITNEKDIVNIFNLLQKMCVQYSNTKKEIEPLYEELVKNESEFSLSYGYGRYIDAFREYLLFDSKVTDVAQDIVDMYGMAQMYAEQQKRGEKIDDTAYFKAREHALDICCEMPSMINNIIMLIKEIRIKYPVDVETKS